ncbi:cation transport protein-domain-containing protein [Zychaea mexicana]|uniref:cation transport protein-domain-containing protein n=1 Tax=Zychaea mexicana TaxID=64656 RepID=UPI0022FF320F|nr:cation transport protein-domain-containing protein [Zychaea mexicana]KAI9494256.1 cation transport protein-domain-containing protein [Zychaea mexicana]
MHPFEQHHQTTTSDPNDLRRVTSATTTVGGSSSSHAGGRTEDTSQQGIAFAGNVEQQREVARKRLEQDRRFEELMAKISREHDIPLTDTLLDSDDEDDEELFQEIMRQPIDKSQLTRQQRYRIGGIEYRALDMLSYIVPLYYVGSIVVASFAYRIHVAVNGYTQGVLETSNPNGPTNAWIFSFFMGMSGMNNLGMSPLDASMVPFQNTPFPLICTMIQILAGNTAYAILLRFIIWVLWKTTPQRYAMRRETFRFLLDHPRRCYTTLFPSTQTWWLLIILVVITVVELVCFLALNYWLPVLEGLPWGSRFLDGLFQSIATRNGKLFSLFFVYPVAISMRNSNVYQERALGIFRGDDDEEGPVKFSESDLRGPAPFIKLRRHPTINSVMTTSRKVLRGPDFYVVNLIQRQLTSDICWVISGIFAIAVIESQSIMSPSPTTMMTVIYECVSAFGNVGASTGYPNTATSQGAQYHTLGKLVLILLMYRGRHRGLPLAIDRAVLLPSEQLEQREVEDNILKRRNTSMTTQSASNVLFYTRSSTL